jgi:hypothetical protein
MPIFYLAIHEDRGAWTSGIFIALWSTLIVAAQRLLGWSDYFVSQPPFDITTR